MRAAGLSVAIVERELVDGAVSVLIARHAVVICTGSRAALPDVPGMAEARPWTNREATDTSSVPNRLAVVGAGGVGMEMATASATIAVTGRVPIDRLWHAVPCFPTISELWLRLLEAYRDSSTL